MRGFAPGGIGRRLLGVIAVVLLPVPIALATQLSDCGTLIPGPEASVGETIEVTGAGYTPGTTVTFLVDGVEFSSAAAVANGDEQVGFATVEFTFTSDGSFEFETSGTANGSACATLPVGPIIVGGSGFPSEEPAPTVPTTPSGTETTQTGTEPAPTVPVESGEDVTQETATPVADTSGGVSWPMLVGLIAVGVVGGLGGYLVWQKIRPGIGRRPRVDSVRGPGETAPPGDSRRGSDPEGKETKEPRLQFGQEESGKPKEPRLQFGQEESGKPKEPRLQFGQEESGKPKEPRLQFGQETTPPPSEPQSPGDSPNGSTGPDDLDRPVEVTAPGDSPGGSGTEIDGDQIGQPPSGLADDLPEAYGDPPKDPDDYFNQPPTGEGDPQPGDGKPPGDSPADRGSSGSEGVDRGQHSDTPAPTDGSRPVVEDGGGTVPDEKAEDGVTLIGQGQADVPKYEVSGNDKDWRYRDGDSDDDD